MKSTKEKILTTLLNKQNATIAELAEIVGINGISVRHHLINLQAEDLVASEEQRHGVGRPRFTYHLTDKGIEKFPSNYLRLTDNILTELKRTLPDDQLTDLFTHIGLDLANKHRVSDNSLPLTEQLEVLSRNLLEEGYRLSWDRTNGSISLYNKNCPYHNIAVMHPEICCIDHTMFANILTKPAVAQYCMARGDPQCIFSIIDD
ncbi:MAG: methanogen output domain 1-containing protein [Anaerolineaceae bacterium]